MWLSVAAVSVLSAAIIALELALMRCLAIARWHHFAYLVISTALLGFGASGTLLTFAGQWLRRRFAGSVTALTLFFAVSVVLSLRAAEALPLDARYVLYSWRQAALMFAHHVLLLVPFLVGATVIGLSLMHFRGRVHGIYAANLIGSGAGGALAVGLMFALPAVRVLDVAAGLGVLAALLWSFGGRSRRRTAAVLVIGVAVVGGGLWKPLELRVDQYKTLSVMRRLEAQGDARHVLTAHSPRGRLDVYESPAQHHALFVTLGAGKLPPAQLTILADGEAAATVFNIRSAAEAEILDYTLMSVPYRLVERPRVLLLGEAGGVNVWLARRMGAAHVTVVQPNPQIVGLMRGPLAGMGGSALTGPDVTVVVAEPRTFIEQTAEHFDIIQLVGAEAMAAGVSGFRSLHEDFLLTTEGLALCIGRLTDGGVVAATRGMQLPPRDNVRLLATFRDALASLDRRAPLTRLAQMRDHQAVVTLAFAAPVTLGRCGQLGKAAAKLGLDVEWAPCEGLMRDSQKHQVAGPGGKPYSYFRHAALALLSGDREALYRGWVYDVRPPRDDSPYFFDFFRWRSLPRFIEAYGDLWLTRLELGYVVLVFALGQVLVVGAGLILLPLLWLRRSRGVAGGRLATGEYFVLLGLAYLMLEIACMLKFTYFLGDPIYAAAGIISSFLVFSGLGSAASRRLCRSPQRAICIAAIGVAALAGIYVVALTPIFTALLGLPLWARFAVAVGLTAPLAFLMGWPFPNGLTLVERGNPPLVPWAWAANGFASVAASPLAVMIAIGAGYSTVLVLAAVLYLLAAAASFGLPSQG